MLLEGDRERLEAELRASEERYRSFIRLSSEGIWRFELDEPVPTDLGEDQQIERFFRHAYLAECNETMAGMYGYDSCGQMVGKRLHEFHESSDPRSAEFLRAFIRNGYRLDNAETQERDRHGGTRVFLNSLMGQVEQGRLVGAWGTQREVTERRNAEERLRRSHDTFYALIQNNPFGVYVVDADFRLREVSLGAQKVFSNVRPLLGRDFAEVLRVIWPEPFAGEAIGRFRHTLERGEAYSSPSTVERRQDVQRVEAYDWRIERILLPDGRFGVVCYFYDLSERQRWESELDETRRKLSSALIAGEVGTFEWDVVNDRLWGDRNFARIFGIEVDAAGASPIARYMAAIHPDDRERVAQRVREAVEGGGDYATEYRIATRGLPRWVIARGKVERDDAGRVVRFPGVVLDVTERKQAELLLAAQNRALELVATGAPLGDALGALTAVVEEQCGGQAVAAILLVDEDGCTLRVGAAPGLPAEYNAAIDGIKARPGLGTCADAAARNEVVVTPDLEAAASWEGLAHLPLALGLRSAWSMPIRASDGRVLGTFGTYFRERREPSARERQIVEGLSRAAALAIERRQAEEALRKSEARYRSLFESIDEGFCVIEVMFDGQGKAIDYRFLETNPAFEQQTGLSGAAGRRMREIVPGHEEHWFEAYGRVARTGEPVRFENTAEALGRVYDVYAFRVGKPEQNRVAILFRDIGERKRVEGALRESEARFRQLADAMPQIVWVTRPDGYHEYYNRRWYEFTGVPEGSTDGEGWNGLFHPDDQQRAWERWRRSLASGEPYEIEYRLRHRGGEYRWTLGRALAIRDSQGRIERWFGTCTDIDAMKRLTAEREHLLERERVARGEAEAANLAKDRFLAVLSHELRTPLSPVVMTIPGMEIDPDLPLKFREDLAMVRRNIELEVKLIDDLLDLSRVSSGKLRLQMQPVRAHELLLHVLRSSAGDASAKGLRVRQELGAVNDLLSADPARLQQVFWNLLRNAVKFTPEGGRVTVRTWNEQGGRLLVEVSDDGVGIPADVLPRVFDAFEQGDARMTRQFGGLGLGLAIAKAVVEMHGGSISAASGGRDRGAAFTVQLATAAAESAARSGEGGGGPPEGGGAKSSRVLLVEDHPDTARTLARLLKSSGYVVKTADSAASALQLAAAEPFDLVVSDIGLPDASGYELMEQIRDRFGIKGIALSGYGMEEDMKKSRDAGFVDHVVKPVEVATLERVMERVLGGGAGR